MALCGNAAGFAVQCGHAAVAACNGPPTRSPMRVALIGPPQSGKSTLFAAVAEAGGSHVDLSRPDRSHLAVVKAPDERLGWLAKLDGSKKTTFAELEFLDVPGLDMTDEAGRDRARDHWPDIRQSDLLVFVVRGFHSDAVATYRGRVNPAADVQELLDEALFADLEQATQRVEKLRDSIRKPTAHRDDNVRELELMERMNGISPGQSQVDSFSIGDVCNRKCKGSDTC